MIHIYYVNCLNTVKYHETMPYSLLLTADGKCILLHSVEDNIILLLSTEDSNICSIAIYWKQNLEFILYTTFNVCIEDSSIYFDAIYWRKQHILLFLSTEDSNSKLICTEESNKYCSYLLKIAVFTVVIYQHLF